MEENKISIANEALETISGGYELIENPGGPTLFSYDSFDEFLNTKGIKDKTGLSEETYNAYLKVYVLQNLAVAEKMSEQNVPR